MKTSLMRLCLFAIFVMSILGITASAQTPAPVDPAWRIGKLENGMTYYIRQNPKPEGKANFYIAHAIGALWETPNQNGLAHFLEHMAFNGLRDFPGKSMLNYMESIGCSFGRNINASTGQELTQYLLTDVPIDREGVIDTCLLILKNWSNGILCEEDELNSERGVIREEWRTGQNAGRRNWNEQAKIFYQGTPYATRSVIGDTSIINNFTQKEILDFYHDWYRPNLQAIVVVGDFDVNKMENKVKALFKDIKGPENEKTKAEFELCDNVEPVVGIYTEPELTQTSIQVSIKFPAPFTKETYNTTECLAYELKTSLIGSMINARLNELQQSPNAPFLMAYSYMNNFVGSRDAFSFYVYTKNSGLATGFEAAMEVMEQARRHGFTKSELDRAKAKLMLSYENAFAERNTRNTGEYNRRAYNHFLRNRALMSEEQQLDFAKKNVPQINVDELNNMVKERLVFGPNTLIYASGPEKEDNIMPNDELIRIIMYGVAKKQIQPYEDVVTDKPLIAKAPKAGKVRKETKNETLGTIEWTMSNGAKVILKPTTFKQDEISLDGFSFGGMSLVAEQDLPSAKVVTSIVPYSGIGEFSQNQLNKMLAGKNVRSSIGLSELTQNVSGRCSPKDLETLLQLTYLRFTAPRFSKEDFETEMQYMRNHYANKDSDPMNILRDTVNNMLVGYNPRNISQNLADFEKADFETMRKVYQERFANPGAFTFIFTGNIDPATAKPLIEKYLGSLSKGKKEKFVDHHADPLKGEIKNHFTQPMKVGKSSVNIIFTGDMKYDQEHMIAMNYLSAILRLRYTEEIREKRGGTYGASVNARVLTGPKDYFQLMIGFDTDPKMQDELIGVAYDELKKIADNGPTAEDFDKTQKNMELQFTQNLKENGYWSSVLGTYYRYDIDNHSAWKPAFDKTTTQTIQDIAKYILAQKNCMEIVMTPAE